MLPHVINVFKIINELFYISFCHTKSSKSCVYFTCNSTFQTRLATFQVLNAWLVATVLDNTASSHIAFSDGCS